MGLNDPVQCPSLEEAIARIRLGGGVEYRAVQWAMVASGNPPSEETTRLLDEAMGEWWKVESARYRGALREVIPSLPTDGNEQVDQWVGTLHPARAGYGRRGFHEMDVAMVLARLADERDPIAAGYRYAASIAILQEESAKEDDLASLASEPNAAATLEAMLGEHLREAATYASDVFIGRAETALDLRERMDREAAEEMTALDSWLASHVEKLGDAGKRLANKTRTDARELWRSEHRPGSPFPWNRFEHWLPDGDPPVRPSKVVRNLARVLWRDVIGPRLLRERHVRPALVRAVHVEATLFHSRQPKFDAKTATLSFEGRKLAERIGATFDVEVIQRGLGLLGSVASHELFHWEVTQGHEQHQSGHPTPHILDIEGGWVALAERLGLKPSKHAANLRALVIAQMSFAFTFPDGSKGNMLVMNERPAIGGRRAHVRLELGSVLMPGYVHAPGLPERERKLVPLLRQRVPLYGRPNEHGEQRTMSLALMAEFRDRARELATQGGAKLDADDFTRLADRSGLVRRLIRPVVEHWVEGDTHAPPFLKRIERDRYTLSDVHAAEREFLETGGHRESEGASRGRRSAASRAAKLIRKTPRNRDK